MDSLEIDIHKQKRNISISIIIIFSVITIIQIINILTVPPNGYIPDIYGYYPDFYWVIILFLIIFCGFLLTYFSLYNINSKLNVLIIFAVLITVCTLYLQNHLLFFFTGRGDPLTHIGFIKDILYYGHMSGNPYPGTHILIASIVMVLNISPIAIMNYIPEIFFLVYFLSMYSIGKIVFKNNKFFYYFIGLASLPIFGFSQALFSPNMSLIFFSPVILYILLKCNTKFFKEFQFLLLTTLIFLSYSHPLVSFLWIILFCLILFIYYFYYRHLNYNKYFLPIVINIVILAILFYYISFLGNPVQDAIKYIADILFQPGSVITGEMAEQLSNISPETSVLKIIRTAIFVYGSYMILAIISALILLYIVYYSLLFKKKFNVHLVLLLLCGFLLYILSLINFIISRFSISRIFNLGNIFTIILIPLFFSLLIKYRPNKKIVLLSLMMVLYSILVIISIFSIHPSAYYTALGNEQVTESEFFALETFHQYRSDLPFFEYNARTVRFYQAINGLITAGSNNLISSSDRNPLKHLGYDQFNTFAEGHGSNIYFLDSRLQYYSKNYPEMAKTILGNNQNIAKFENDISLNSIYSNAQTTIYLVD